MNYDPQSYKGGPYPWKYGGYDGYQGYGGSGPFPFDNRDMGYVNHQQGIGGYNAHIGKKNRMMGIGGDCIGCKDAAGYSFYDSPYQDGNPYNPFDDDYSGGLAWNLRK